MKAFVAGATGRTGRRIVEQLVARGIPVRALVRSLERGQAELPPQAELVVGDVGDLAVLKEAIADCTVVLCATGAAPSLDPRGPYQVDLEGTKNLVNASIDKKIDQFVLVSSLCVSKFFHPLNAFWLILFWKKQAEEYLQKSGLSYTIVRPGGLLDTDNTDGLVIQEADTLFEGRIPREKVAQVCVEALSDPNARNKVLEIIAKPDVSPLPMGELFARVA